MARGTTGAAMFVFKAVFAVVGPLLYMPDQECGERHLFLATSARYPAGVTQNAASGVPLADGVAVARGINGQSGSGVYSVDSHGESSGPKVEELLANFRKDGMVETVWKDTQEQFTRITGTLAVQFHMYTALLKAKQTSTPQLTFVDVPDGEGATAKKKGRGMVRSANSFTRPATVIHNFTKTASYGQYLCTPTDSIEDSEMPRSAHSSESTLI
ncbi:hypothetical protein LTR28_007354 [Elasticomyces elasticus]|nr:hypothetical protein LTR28_007354 [Elasticomyces elasticus]